LYSVYVAFHHSFALPSPRHWRGYWRSSAFADDGLCRCFTRCLIVAGTRSTCPSVLPWRAACWYGNQVHCAYFKQCGKPGTGTARCGICALWCRAYRTRHLRLPHYYTHAARSCHALPRATTPEGRNACAAGLALVPPLFMHAIQPRLFQRDRIRLRRVTGATAAPPPGTVCVLTAWGFLPARREQHACSAGAAAHIRYRRRRTAYPHVLGLPPTDGVQFLPTFGAIVLPLPTAFYYSAITGPPVRDDIACSHAPCCPSIFPRGQTTSSPHLPSMVRFIL